MDSTADQTDLTFLSESKPPLETDMSLEGLETPKKDLQQRASFAVWKSSVNGVDIMRRAQDAFFNASHIALLIELPKTRESFLKQAKEGVFDEVSTGNSEIQGIWVPLERITALAKQYHIYNELQPLLKSVKSPSQQSEFATPVKKRSNSISLDLESSVSPSKKSKLPLKIYNHDTRIKNPDFPYSFKPISETPDDEKSRYVISNLFLPDGKSKSLLDLVDGNQSQLAQLNIDISIDDNGQTALHLASTLGKIDLVKELIEAGANRLRGDNDGQTPLVRALLATNCYELGCFDKLLDLLYPCLTIIDNRGRTVLHHIAITCGLKGRDDASKYYLATLLGWIVTKGSQIPNSDHFKLINFRKTILNKSDKYGNTCLNYATFTGDKYLVSQLLDIGADANKANKIGVKPGDWGVEMTCNNTNGKDVDSDLESDVLTQADGGLTNLSTPNGRNEFKENNADGALNGNTSNSLKILESIQDFIGQLGKKYKDDVSIKSKEIEKLNPIFKEKTTQLSKKRKQYDELEKMVRKISEFNSKIENLDKAINNEENKFKDEVKELNIKMEGDDQLGDYDADQPFIIDSIYSEIENQINKIINNKISKETSNSEEILSIIEAVKPEQIFLRSDQVNDLPNTSILNARIAAYERNNEELLDRLREKKKSSIELEQQFKRIIALCIGSDVNKIDDKLLGNLLMSVENEPDPEIGEIKKVLKIVNDLENSK